MRMFMPLSSGSFNIWASMSSTLSATLTSPSNDALRWSMLVTLPL